MYIQKFKPLASFCGCAGRFESYLVENPEDGFSREVAQIPLFFSNMYYITLESKLFCYSELLLRDWGCLADVYIISFQFHRHISQWALRPHVFQVVII